jgi:signal transduction histidine kinase
MDNEAKNGTFVNNRRIEEHELQGGDEIQLGPTLCLVFADARWGKAGGTDKMAQRAAREKLSADRFQRERVASLASMVAGIAHEINTPLGVASTANAMIATLAEEVRRDPTSEKLDELLADLRMSTGLVGRNLERVSQLVQTFKQLSAYEFSEDRVECDLRALIDECVADLQGDMTQGRLTVRSSFQPDGEAFPWVGFPKSVLQVLIQLFQNVLRHAYPEGGVGGSIDIRLIKGRAARAGDGYRLELQDYGAGLPDEILARLFEPFVTSRRQKGGMGLGLAIVRNVVTHVLGGTIRCASERGKGTHFVILLPREAPIAKADA